MAILCILRCTLMLGWQRTSGMNNAVQRVMTAAVRLNCIDDQLALSVIRLVY